MVESCKTCQTHQPLKPTILSEIPWQHIATDLFSFKNQNNLFIVDYYSHYIELFLLSNITSATFINSLKSIFARHGMPGTLR